MNKIDLINNDQNQPLISINSHLPDYEKVTPTLPSPRATETTISAHNDTFSRVHEPDSFHAKLMKTLQTVGTKRNRGGISNNTSIKVEN